MSSVGGASHSLAFRVMRLCRPSCQLDAPLLVDPGDITTGEDLFEADAVEQPIAKKKVDTYWRRFELEEPADALGISGVLVLPQTFGSIYLGETFCSYISVGNHTSHEVRDVVIKAELHTERQRIVLADNAKAPLNCIRAAGRYDFIIEHDIKELGGHTLVCNAVYTDIDGDRKYLPQYFKFTTSNPISVRTKVRSVKDVTFLEACIENQTKSHLFMDEVRFEPASPWIVSGIDVGDEKDTSDGPISAYIRKLQLVSTNGGARHYLFRLTRPPSESAVFKIDGGNTLGKLEITWRTNLGETGRLQTQQILGNPVPFKEVGLKILEMPLRIIVEMPFLVRISVRNLTDHRVGPLKVSMSHADDPGSARKIVPNGLRTLIVPHLDPDSSTELALNLVALASGIQQIANIGVVDMQDGKPYDTIVATEVFVESTC